MFKVPWLMGCAYEGDENELGSFFLDWKSGKDSWKYDEELYKKRNEAEGLFCRG